MRSLVTGIDAKVLYTALIAWFFKGKVAGASCADLGCGKAFTPLALSKVCRVVYAYDIDEAVCAMYRGHARVKPVCEDVEEVEVLGDGHLTLVLALNILEHLSNPLKALRKICSSMDRGGYLVVSVPSPSIECRGAFKCDSTHKWLLPREKWIKMGVVVGFVYNEEVNERFISLVKHHLIKALPRSFGHLYRASAQYPYSGRVSGYLGAVVGLMTRRTVVNPCSELLVFKKP